MSKRWIVLVTNKEGLDTLCKNKIFVGLIQNKLINGSMIDDVAGGIYWISIDLPQVKRTQFIIEELSTIILAKEVKPYLVMDCIVRTNSKMSEKLEFGVDDEKG